MKAHPFVAERDKPAEERGYYTDPVLFGAPAQMGITYAKRDRAQAKAADRGVTLKQ